MTCHMDIGWSLETKRKRPKICIKCNKRATFGERKRETEREREREREIEREIERDRERESKKVWPKVNRLISNGLQNTNLKNLRLI